MYGNIHTVCTGVQGLFPRKWPNKTLNTSGLHGDIFRTDGALLALVSTIRRMSLLSEEEMVVGGTFFSVKIQHVALNFYAIRSTFF